MARPIDHGMSDTRLYRIWNGMKNRSERPHAKDFARYGARGIGLCPEWSNFVPFMEWSFANGYQDDFCIDRIDNHKGYSPNNCRWVSLRDSCTHRRDRSEWKRRSNTKFSAQQIAAIAEDYRAGMTLKELSIKHGCSPAYAGEIGRGQKRLLDQ